MPTAQTIFSFFGIALVLGFTPGPDNIFVMLQSASHGRRSGFYVVLGLCTGLIVHTVAVALGLAAVFAASRLAFVTLKLLGAAYLAYLAWQAFRAPVSEADDVVRADLPPEKLFVRGIVMNLTNPKVIFFFLAFLPQFVDPSQGAVATQLAVLGSIFILATLVAFGTISFFAASVGQTFRRSASAQRLLNRVAGTVFAALAVRLAITDK